MKFKEGDILQSEWEIVEVVSDSGNLGCFTAKTIQNLDTTPFHSVGYISTSWSKKYNWKKVKYMQTPLWKLLEGDND